MARTDLSGVTAAGYAFEFFLELFELGNPRLQILKMSGGDLMRLMAWPFRALAQINQFADILDRQSQLPGVADEGKPLKPVLRIAALIA